MHFGSINAELDTVMTCKQFSTMIALIFTVVVQSSLKEEKWIQPLGFLLCTWWSELHLQEADRKHGQPVHLLSFFRQIAQVGRVS